MSLTEFWLYTTIGAIIGTIFAIWRIKKKAKQKDKQDEELINILNGFFAKEHPMYPGFTYKQVAQFLKDKKAMGISKN